MTAGVLSPASANALVARGQAVLIDIRSPTEFAGGHARGSLSVPFSRRGLDVRIRAILGSGTPVVIVAADEATAEAAVAQLDRSGVAMRGVLEGGYPAWRDAGLPVRYLAEIGVEEVPRLAAASTIVDVREPLEWTTGYVPGALLVPLGQLRGSIPSIPRDRPVIAICEAGVRSCTAASLLASAGFTEVAHVPDGSAGYRAAGLPLTFPTAEVAGR